MFSLLFTLCPMTSVALVLVSRLKENFPFYSFFFFALKQLEVICFSDNSDGFNSLTALRNTRGEYNKVYNVTCVSEVEPAVLCKSSLPGKHFGK